MKINLKVTFVILSLFAVLIPITYSYATAKTDQNIDEKSFFEISKLEVTKNEKVEMILNLNTIKYDNFIFELQASENIENIEISKNNNVETEKKYNEIVMEINKEKTNINSINLYYSIPENKKVGDTIKFVATVTNIVNEEQEQSTENNNVTETQTKQEEENNTSTENESSNKNSEQIIQTKKETQKIELEVKVIEEKNNNSKDDQLSNTDEQSPGIESNKEETTSNQNLEKANMQSTNQKASSQSISTSYGISSNQTVQVTYKGSDNNYLSELSVEGYSLNKGFSKDNMTYFVTIENEIETLNITTVTDHNKAIVFVYGNENLKEGINKILISVTAENGNVRNYRIYVTRKA